MVREVGEGVYSIALAWSNAYLLREGQRSALIDTGLQQDRHRLREALATLGVADREVRDIYLTHAHCDHAGSAAYFAAQGAAIHLHRAEARYLARPLRPYALTGFHMLLRPLSMLALLAGEGIYPVQRCGSLRLLEEDDCLAAPGGSLQVVFCPGHTPGHIAFFRPRDRLLFSGDAILHIVPIKRVTGLSLPLRIVSDRWEQCRRSARVLTRLCPDALLAGHGHPLLNQTAPLLKAWAETLQSR